MRRPTNTVKLAMYAGGALVLVGVVGIGILEMIAGSPHPVSAEGRIVHEALVPLRLRSYVILLGLLVWGAAAVAGVLGGDDSGGA